MRAIFIFVILATLLMMGCASIEIAKEVTKVTKKVETSVKKIFQSPNEMKIEVEKQEISKEEEKIEQKIEVEKQEISKEQKKISTVVTKQKKISNINLLNKTMKELYQLIGRPHLIRKDGKTITARFDSRSCRLFVFMNSALKTPLVEYYELRNIEGKLIDHQKNIETCFKEIKPV